ncbi:SidA/IucD/PvdA family monooxygenase [Nocardia brasiliensis]|uniref:L-lysine N6-monooxygenase MbtG n=1 Tax=Nocardia brasiliensis TaxID=37326 RepID=A0A6G9Y3G0_NOCBR|nr:SidA/IucD/PvdA family monooxygenase [Nocardia brasiliensis]QIS07742.1 SidA/IucD/PvdA family monooxygenase [Nocardia brasiliensis]
MQATPIYDVLGVGFGPANLAVAIALREERATAGNGHADMLFFERQPSFGWHRGMLVDGATMQIAFLKDLATLRNPQSDFTFVSYLHAKDRLSSFINSNTLYPLRVDFHEYLEWAARHFEGQVQYGAEVISLRPVVVDGSVESIEVGVRANHATTVYRTRNVVIGAGQEPRLPSGVAVSDRVWHTSQLLHSAAGLDQAPPRRIVVVGSGQSAAESVDFLYRRFSEAEIWTVHSRFGYSVADDSPFVNSIFDPDSVGRFYSAPADVKEMLQHYHRNTNYSVVDLELSRAIYQKIYEESVVGRQRLYVLNVSKVLRVEELNDSVRLEIEDLSTGAVRELDADVVLYATGYVPSDPGTLLMTLAEECKRDAEGRLVLDRDYRVVMSASMRCGIYVHGSYAEHSHGLSAGLLSNVAARAGEIVRSIHLH